MGLRGIVVLRVDGFDEDVKMTTSFIISPLDYVRGTWAKTFANKYNCSISHGDNRLEPGEHECRS